MITIAETEVLSTSSPQSVTVLSMQDKQAIIQWLDKGAKGTHLLLKYGISKQQMSEIRKNREKIMKSTNNLETSEELQWESL